MHLPILLLLRLFSQDPSLPFATRGEPAWMDNPCGRLDALEPSAKLLSPPSSSPIGPASPWMDRCTNEHLSASLLNPLLGSNLDGREKYGHTPSPCAPASLLLSLSLRQSAGD